MYRKLFSSFSYKKIMKSSPFKELNDKSQCIFIHIPKCAGISIEDALFAEKVGHRPILQFKYADKKRYKHYFKFTFVRNPWDRLVSSFFFLKKGGRNPVDKEWAVKNLSYYNDFNEFVYSLNKRKIRKAIISQQHFKPQYYYITNELGQIAVDYVGRVENIRYDFYYLANRLGINAKIEHKNKSDHAPYTSYYDSKSKDIVAKIYKKDIKLLNYSFGD